MEILAILQLCELLRIYAHLRPGVVLLILQLLLHHLLSLSQHDLLLLLLSDVLWIVDHLLLHLLLMLLLHHAGLWVQMAHGHGIRCGTTHGLSRHSHNPSGALTAHGALHAAWLHTHQSSGLHNMWISAS